MSETLQNYPLSIDLATQNELNDLSSELTTKINNIQPGGSTAERLSVLLEADGQTFLAGEVYPEILLKSFDNTVNINGMSYDSQGDPPDPRNGKLIGLDFTVSKVPGTLTIEGKQFDGSENVSVSLSGYAPLSATQELSTMLGNILSALQEINGTGNGGSGGYSGFIPTSDPLYYKVTKDGISISRQIQGPPLSWFQSNTDTESSYSDNGTFKFTFDGNGNIIVTVDGNIGSIYSGTAPYSLGDTVATIDQTTLIPTSTNGTFEWIESL